MFTFLQWTFCRLFKKQPFEDKSDHCADVDVDTPKSTNTQDKDALDELTLADHLQLGQDEHIWERNAAEIVNAENFPYLCDAETVRFIRRSRVMFIMRKTSYEGGSILSKLLVRTYHRAELHTEDSRDWGDKNRFGSSEMDSLRESEADIIIIEKPALRPGLFAYLGHQRESHHSIIIDPLVLMLQTEGEVNSDTNVSNEEMQDHLADYHSLRAMYYGWFLNEADAEDLVQQASTILQLCAQIPPTDGTMDHLSLQDIFAKQQQSSYYIHVKTNNLHCTAVYAGRDKSSLYHSMDLLVKSIGKKFSLTVSGYYYSSLAIFAVVDLHQSSHPTIMPKLCRNDGRSAHVTIAYAEGRQAKVSGEELLSVQQLLRGDHHHLPVVQLPTDIGSLTFFGQSRYMVTLTYPIMIDCLFRGYL